MAPSTLHHQQSQVKLKMFPLSPKTQLGFIGTCVISLCSAYSFPHSLRLSSCMSCMSSFPHHCKGVMGHFEDSVYFKSQIPHSPNSLSTSYNPERRYVHCWLFSKTHGSCRYVGCHRSTIEWVWSCFISTGWTQQWLRLICNISYNPCGSNLLGRTIWSSTCSWESSWA